MISRNDLLAMKNADKYDTYGSTRFPTLIKKALKEGLTPADSVMFCTDDKSPTDIMENGCIDKNIRTAISCGMAPITAIKIATLNAARHFGIEHRYGSCTPGRYADIVLFDDLYNINIKKVFFKGELIARNGRITGMPRRTDIKKYPCLSNSIIFSEDLSAEDMLIKIRENANVKKAKVICISMNSGSLISHKSEAVLNIENGFICPDIENDILPIAVIERYGKSGNIGKAFIKGLGIKRGAVASSTAQESNNIVVSGTNAEDMFCAINAVKRAGGGSAVCIERKTVAVRSFPLAGIMGIGTLDEEIGSLKKFDDSLKQTGSREPRLMEKLTVSLCPSIPEIGITDMGIIDVDSGKFIKPFQIIQEEIT